MKRTLLTLLIAAACCPAQSLVQRAPAKAASKKNPFEGRDDAPRAGAKLYDRECAACHGVHGEGTTKAPPLATPILKREPDGAIEWAIRTGSKKKGMPSFSNLPEPQRWQIVTYLKSIPPPDK